MPNKKMAPRKLYDAVRRNQLEKVGEMIEAGYDLDARLPSSGEAALHLAAATDPKIVQNLINAGADIEIRDRDLGRTPLFWAAAGGGSSAVDLLIKAGANVNACDESTTPLYEARRMLEQSEKFIQKLESKKKAASRQYTETVKAVKQFEQIIASLLAAGAVEDQLPEEIQAFDNFEESFWSEQDLQASEQQKIETLRGVFDVDGNYNELYVLAPADKTAAALTELRGAKSWQKQVDDHGVTLTEHGCFVIQFKGHRWSQVLDPVWNRGYSGEAEELSQTLNTRAIYFSYSDTAGAFEYNLYESGKLLERLAFCEGHVDGYESKLRQIDPKQIEKQRTGFVDAFFKDQDLVAAIIAYSVLVPAENSAAGQRLTFDHIEWYEFNRIDYIELAPPANPGSGATNPFAL